MALKEVTKVIIKDVSKDDAELLIEAVKDLRPNMKISIIAEDYALYQLGLVKFIPCTVDVEATDEEIFDLLDEVEQMEMDYMNFEDEDLRKPEMRKLQKELAERFACYAIIAGYLED